MKKNGAGEHTSDTKSKNFQHVRKFKIPKCQTPPSGLI